MVLYKSHFESISDFRIKKSKYVYFGWDYERGITKIGRGSNPMDRIKSISTIANINVFPIAIGIPYEDSNVIESRIHAMFKSNRLKGEWFDMNPYDLISKIKFQDLFKVFWIFNPKINGYSVLYNKILFLNENDYRKYIRDT